MANRPQKVGNCTGHIYKPRAMGPVPCFYLGVTWFLRSLVVFKCSSDNWTWIASRRTSGRILQPHLPHVEESTVHAVAFWKKTCGCGSFASYCHGCYKTSFKKVLSFVENRWQPFGKASFPRSLGMLLGCRRMLGSMVSKWVISPTCKWGIPWGEITHLYILIY